MRQKPPCLSQLTFHRRHVESITLPNTIGDGMYPKSLKIWIVSTLFRTCTVFVRNWPENDELHAQRKGALFFPNRSKCNHQEWHLSNGDDQSDHEQDNQKRYHGLTSLRTWPGRCYRYNSHFRMPVILGNTRTVGVVLGLWKTSI